MDAELATLVQDALERANAAMDGVETGLIGAAALASMDAAFGVAADRPAHAARRRIDHSRGPAGGGSADPSGVPLATTGRAREHR